MTTADKLLFTSARAGLELQGRRGEMPPGRNGPHNHKMTPARNTSHWVILFTEAYLLTRDDQFRRAANKGVDFLLSPEARPVGGAFWQRCQAGKHSYNGLIGQAWTIEALAHASKKLYRHDAREVALAVFLAHEFEEELGLWRQMDLDGSSRIIEPTLNQQIWFAASGLLLAADNAIVVARVSRFLDALKHHLGSTFSPILPTGIMNPLRRAIIAAKHLRRGNISFRREVAIGYHLFSLSGLAVIRMYFPEHHLWHATVVSRAIAVLFRQRFVRALRTSRFAFPYNVPGLEMPQVASVFSDLVPSVKYEDSCREVFDMQLDEHLDSATGLLRRNTTDPETLSARAYEVYRIPARMKQTLG